MVAAETSLLGETEQAAEPSAQKETREIEQEVPTGTTAATDVDWETYAENMATAPSMPAYRPDSDEMPTLEQAATGGPSLSEHLMIQLQMAKLPPTKSAAPS